MDRVTVKIDNDMLDDPVRIKSVGGRRWVVVGCALIITVMLGDINIGISNANKLKEEDIKIRKEQLELARRQFQLDSIAMMQK